MGAASELRLSVQVQPRASRNEIVGRHGDALKVRLTAPPVDGAANQALVELLAGRLGLPRGNVRVVTGATARRKIVAILGAPPAEVLWERLLAQPPKR